MPASAQLPPAEADLFYKLFFPLLAFVTQRHPAEFEARVPEHIAQTPFPELVPVRDKVYAQPEIIQAFVAENPYGLSDDELAIVREWLHFVKGNFVVMRLLKSYAVFLDPSDPPKAYGVLALKSRFDEMVDVPVMVGAVLLPFRGRISYDGILTGAPLRFGPGYRESLEEAYQRAKSAFGIITSLPFAPPAEQASHQELLRFYVKSQRNRERYQDEIAELLQQTPALLPVYHQELGRRNAATYKRRFRELGVAPAWFAILDELLIASGKTRDDVSDTVSWLVPTEKRGFVFVFRWGP